MEVRRIIVGDYVILAKNLFKIKDLQYEYYKRLIWQVLELALEENNTSYFKILRITPPIEAKITLILPEHSLFSLGNDKKQEFLKIFYEK